MILPQDWKNQRHDGRIMTNTRSDIIDKPLKLIILLGKFHIHKAKVMSIKPSFIFFCKDVKMFHDSLNSITNDNSITIFPIDL